MTAAIFPETAQFQTANGIRELAKDIWNFW
jgi:hypothetical protein